MGRPKLPPNEKRTIRIDVHLSPDEVALLDAVRGDVPRAAFLRDEGLKEQLLTGRKEVATLNEKPSR